MNKAQLIQSAAVISGKDQKTVTLVLNAIIETIEETVVNGESVVIVDFGQFKPVDCKARFCSNPATGGKIEIPATTKPVFKAGKGFKDKVNDRRSATQ